MSLRDIYNGDETPEVAIENLPDRAKGRITRVQLKDTERNKKGGWGFIHSDEIPFTRIFFFWQALLPNTLRFIQLKVGMKVEFTPVNEPGRGLIARKIKVLEDV